ncbi:glycoside hydrolase [Byssothecium circinans]|uniref:glucan endo-1,3-beta-D-glucosidase n=1 Tax=Byssothecium circinans TaxID=147558 RepID=A0A6A5TGR6_9PLEO|nr:glycoside hydrolase [Byssothecium circinans]
MAYPNHLSQSHPPSQPYENNGDVSPIDGSFGSQMPPQPPPHRNAVGMHYNQNPNNYSDYSPPGVTPGADNLGTGAAGGGINGIAMGVAGSHERESGVQALREMHSNNAPLGIPQERTPFSDSYAYDSPTQPRPTHSAASLAPSATMYSSNSSQQSMPLTSGNPYPYADSPYNRYSSSNLNLAPQMGQINPNDLADDDDWGITPVPNPQKRRSFAPFGSGSRDGPPNSAATAAAAGAAGAGAGVLAASGSRDGSGSYNAVPTGEGSNQEKSEWLDRQDHGKKRLMWIVSSIIAIVIVGAIVGGVLGSVLNKKSGGGNSSGSKTGAGAVADDNKDDLTVKSAEIAKLMDNKDLHKVFPGMDYTPLNTQYPECMHVPASQNNITRDMAVMSLLTSAVRLYGTDCNQTQMVLHAMEKLELKDMKVWLGVWLGNNQTTNDRQVSQMWEIIDEEIKRKNSLDRFKGVIVGNEVLYRKDLNETALIKYITDIKGNLTKHGHELPIATSDLGDNWTAEMAKQVNVVMSNVHPFFAGVEASKAANWTMTFWTTHDVQLTASNTSISQVISEVGWPSGGGKHCGNTDCTSGMQGSVASVDDMNLFMKDWVCPRLEAKTEYFWFSAFDEPWKIRYNEKGKEWEDKWGLMDVNRNLKNGVKIPDCGGKTVSSS